MAMETVDRIEQFYEETMGVPTHISQYKVSQDRAWIEEVVKKNIVRKDGIICYFPRMNAVI